MEGIVVGFYLVMVSILPNGNVKGEAIDYFTDPLECIYAGNWEEENAPFGVGFVCLEDVVNEDDANDWYVLIICIILIGAMIYSAYYS